MHFCLSQEPGTAFLSDNRPWAWFSTRKHLQSGLRQDKHAPQGILYAEWERLSIVDVMRPESALLVQHEILRTGTCRLLRGLSRDMFIFWQAYDMTVDRQHALSTHLDARLYYPDGSMQNGPQDEFSRN